MATDNRILIEVELDQAKAQKEFVRLTKLITAQRSELTKYRKILKESGGTNEEAAQEVANLSRAIKENSKDLRIYERELNATDNSTEALRVQTSKLQREQNKLNTSTKQGQKRFAELEAQLKENREQLNSNSKAAGSFKDNIGNYTASIQEAISGNALFANSLGDAAEGFKILQLAGGPIVALITAIIGALSVFFTRSREGRQTLERLKAVAQATFGVILDLISDGVKGVIEFVSSFESFEDALNKIGDAIKENLQKRLEGAIKLFKVLGRIATLDFDNFSQAAQESFDALVQVSIGAEDATESLSKLGETISDTASRADALAKLNIRLKDSIRAQNEAAREAQRDAERFRKQRDDEFKSLEERLALNQKVLDEEEKRTKAQLAANKARQQIIRNEIQLGGGFVNATEDQLNELSDLRAEAFEIEEDFAGRTTEVLTEANSIRREELQAQINLEKAILEQRLINEEIAGEELLKLRLSIIAKEEEAALVGLKDGSVERNLVLQEFKNKRLEIAKEITEGLKTELQERANVLVTEAQATADRQLEVLTGNLDKEVEARKKALQEEKKIADARVQVQEAARNQFSQLTQSIIQLFGERSAAAKAAFVFEQGLAINDVIIRGVQAAALISSTYPPPLNIPFLALNAAATAAGVATIAQQTVQGFKEGGFIDALSGQPVPNRSFARGGFTGNAGTSTPVGAVHGGEMVISAPRVKALGGPKAVSAMTGQSINGFASGGMVSTNAVSNVRTATFAQQIEAAIANMPSPIVTVKDFDEVKRRSDRVLVKANQ